MKLFDIGIPLALFVVTTLINEEYKKLIILSAKSVLQNLFFVKTILSISSLFNQLLSKHYQVLFD